MRDYIEERYQKSLSDSAKLYSGLGYSVIPTYGDTQPNKTKVAAVNWKHYQTFRPSDEQIMDWFEGENYGGLAIVTGRVSNLIVLDFDSGRLQYQFEKQFSDLLTTRIVTSASRGLSHFYYELPVYINMATQHIEGADLLSNGSYVIAPPTVIQGKAYKIQHGGMPYKLSEWDAQRLKKFFNETHDLGRALFPSLQLSSKPKPTLEVKKEAVQSKPRSQSISPESLIHLYQHYAPLIGRNNALFKVARHGRDHQLNITQVQETLKTVHAQQLTHQSHIPETQDQRIQEAENTIQSAFSRPPQAIPTTQSQLTNSIREALLKKGLTCVARVLDGLFLHGFKSGDIITKKIVTDTLKEQVGRHSVLATFNAQLSPDMFVFETVENPPPRTPTHTSVAEDKTKTHQTKCFLFSQSKPDKNPRGRTPTQYRIPDINALCHLLGVPFTRSDPLQAEDIQKAKAYRQAVHRELIKRRPSMYDRGWLAKRIGVSRRTSQRYDNDIGIQRKAMFIYQPITWKNLNIIPADEPIAGKFLEDGDRKRYPGLRQIAARLLAQKKIVKYAYQDVNYYWYGDNLPLMSVRWGINPKQKEADENFAKTKKFLIQQYWKNLHAKQHVQPASKAQSTRKKTTRSNNVPFSNPTHRSHPSSPNKAKPKSKRAYQKALSDSRAEYLATRLYQAISEKATQEKSRLSQANARKLVDEYGETLIRRGLGVLKHRQNIKNPAGFMIVWLRSTAKGLGV